MIASALEINTTDHPRVYSLPPHVSFADAIAAHLLDIYARQDPLALAKVQIIVPNQRAVRTVSEAFLRLSTGALLLPRLSAIGDTDEIEDLALLDPQEELSLPPAITPLERLMALVPLVQKWGTSARNQDFSPAEALRYARALAHVIDQFEYGEADPAMLQDLVAGDLAVHWQRTTQFLDIVFAHWPQLLAERGRMNPAARRVTLLRALEQRWRTQPPPHPILIAGSTGTIPAVARLMQIAARLPLGAVLLPGLDPSLDDTSWETLAKNHPQYALKQVLERMDVNRAEVQDWPHPAATPAQVNRTRFTHAALWPPAKTADWRAPENNFASTDIGSVQFLEAASDDAEARTIALVVREALEVPEQRVGIVTGDRPLARRIAAQLRRYDILVDDSAGQALSLTPPAVLLRQLALTANTQCAPLELLALLKHPLAKGAGTRADWLRGVRALDIQVLRGLRPAPGLIGIRDALQAAKADKHTAARPLAETAFKHSSDLLTYLDVAIGDFCALFDEPSVATHTLIDAHIIAAQTLAGEALAGAALWQGPAGSALSSFLNDVRASLPDGMTIQPADYNDWLETLLAGEVIRPRFGNHPRVSLLSPIEARLQQQGVTILAGLNEGSWPPTASADPFLADHMRAQLGLPTSEFRLGQAAHDFAQGLGAPTMFLTRSRKSNDSPTLASRLWLRARACLNREDASTALALIPYVDLAAALDMPMLVRPMAEPLPTALKTDWPKTISVSDMAMLRQNPFAFHAKKILKLYPLDDLDADPGAADRGTFIHAALEKFFKLAPEARTRAAFLEIGETVFAPILKRPLTRLLWWPRFETLVDAVLASELMVDETVQLYLEKAGGWSIGDIIINGRADRIDKFADGSVIIYDYKTGSVPSYAKINSARTPQLALLGLMAENNGFDGLAPTSVSALGHVVAKGGTEKPLEIKILDMKKISSVKELLDKTAAILSSWIALLEQPTQPFHYLSVPGETNYRDYDYLARVDEWEGD
jgi:ATP-dependent helicase/nuclease subunit B